MTYIDISPPLDESYAQWPTDQKLTQQKRLKLESGHSINLSSLEATAHIGAHANSPYITDDQGLKIGEMDVSNFIGPCQVIEVQASDGEIVGPSHLKEEITQPRVLFKTGTADSLETFPENYAALSVELVELLHKKGVILIGIDTPGLDLYKDCSKVLAQNCASKYKIATLECLYLKDVRPGVYELIAPPLKLMDFEASPVRALLKK